ncbi:hypothetical protein IEQ34_017719 [Dendrobium chrysotoxum]|uniref:Uncharacterized protein n=1 Tax=Dendrobium chrysotoxum TaxID=161865 RepID=A0AAV7GCG6_DENCH|nr:hypothetical protein IEQ34_017719 [Dendrobium chrysotoxum]
MQLKQISWLKWPKILMSRVILYPAQLRGEAEKGQSFEEFEVNKNIINLYTGHQAIKFSSNGGSFMIYENLVFISCHLGF